MPPPVPLTACQAPDLDWSRPGTPSARGFDDIYFSVEGGLAETETVFLKSCGLPERWQTRRCFVIGELGFGTGLNFLAAWKLWQDTKPKGGRLHFISMEKYPLNRDQLAKALSAWPELKPYADPLIAAWPGPVKGFHRRHFGDVTLTLLHDDAAKGLSGLTASVDAWFLDGFSPAKNPDMWSPDITAHMARVSAPGARVGTFTAAGSVRQALSAAGFEIEKKAGFGKKRHRVEGVFPGQFTEPEKAIHPIIIGGGIAGSSVARSFMRRGIQPILIDPDDGTAASGNAAAIVKPRLDIQDRPESRFFLASYLYALAEYEAAGDIISRGVFHAAKTDKDQIRFEKLTKNGALPASHMRAGIGPWELPGLNFESALVIDPVATCRSFQKGCERVAGRVTSISQTQDGLWQVCFDGDRSPLTGTHLVNAVGAGVRDIDGLYDSDLRYSRGQISWAGTDLSQPLTYGGYGIPMGEKTLIGATHKRLDDRSPFEVRPEDDAENMEGYANISGRVPRALPMASRSSVRVTTANSLPVAGSVNDGLWIITGLGSRGFVFAPLLAENIVSAICQEPRALSISQEQAFRRERCPT
jgi:tRNA 5-methylaminomethyl-2-thiouridine biosynthesis bifunctional protein